MSLIVSNIVRGVYEQNNMNRVRASDWTAERTIIAGNVFFSVVMCEQLHW